MRGHLPDENPGFVGRRTELERMSAALAEHRLVTVTGVGGVEDEQQPVVGEPAAEPGGGHAGGVVGEVDGVGDEGDEEAFAVELSEVGPPGAVGVAVAHPVGGAQREAGLADAADAGHGDEAVLRQGGGDALQFRAAACESRVLVR